MKFKSVSIHPFKYALKYPRNKSSDNHGTTDRGNKEICIYPHKNKQAERDTLLHEIVHALLHESNLLREEDDRDDREKKEEEFVLRFTPRLLAFLQDNPQIINYLVNQDENEK